MSEGVIPGTPDFQWVQELLQGTPRSPQHVDGSKSDRFAWEDAIDGSLAIQDLLQANQRWPGFPALFQDTFQAFYKLNPSLRPAEHVDPVSAANRPYVEQMLSEPATAQTRTQTQMDALASAVAALAAGKKPAEQLAENPELDQAMRQTTPPPPTCRALWRKPRARLCKRRVRKRKIFKAS